MSSQLTLDNIYLMNTSVHTHVRTGDRLSPIGHCNHAAGLSNHTVRLLESSVLSTLLPAKLMHACSLLMMIQQIGSIYQQTIYMPGSQPHSKQLTCLMCEACLYVLDG
jgi:hypothetical protein